MSERKKIYRVMKKVYAKLRRYPNVMSFNIDGTKITNDVDTGKPCITVFVTRKGIQLNPEDNFPTEIDGVLIDIVEHSTPDFELGETSVSRLNPFLQKRMVGGLNHG